MENPNLMSMVLKLYPLTRIFLHTFSVPSDIIFPNSNGGNEILWVKHSGDESDQRIIVRWHWDNVM